MKAPTTVKTPFRARTRLAGVIALALNAGCGAEGMSGGDGVASCTRMASNGTDTIMACLEISGPGALAGAMQTCGPALGAAAGARSTVAATGCSHVNAGGGCAVVRGIQTVTVWYYQTPLGDVQWLCGQVGATYVAP